MPPITNVTVQVGIQGGTTIITRADGDANGRNISVRPTNVRWIPLPKLAEDYYIVDGAGQHWDTICTMPPANDMDTGYFTGK
ncbi:MAG TPA: hypothetical protein VJZ00_16405 [Thermoanaerobaculia bacterium]|nr:hypothetical protein [Thermoanaerobaculia bacterium]